MSAVYVYMYVCMEVLSVAGLFCPAGRGGGEGEGSGGMTCGRRGASPGDIIMRRRGVMSACVHMNRLHACYGLSEGTRCAHHGGRGWRTGGHVTSLGGAGELEGM